MKVIDRRRGQYVLIGVLSLWLLACTGVPEGVDPVTGFDQNRYLGMIELIFMLKKIMLMLHITLIVIILALM